VKKLLLLSALFLLALSATAHAAVPIQASRTALIDAEIRSVRLRDSGNVRVEVKYRCDERYGDAPPRISVRVSHFDSWTGDGAICDGTAHTVVRLLKPLEGQQLGEGFLVSVEVTVADSPSNPYPGGLWAGDRDEYSVEPDGSLRRLTDLRIQRTRVNDRGRLVVGMSYECPTGMGVGVEDPDWADVVMYQGQDEWVIYDTLAHDVVCDGTRHTLVRRFRAGPMDPTQPVSVNAKIENGWNAQISWPH
jgi:hypothetical protein